jgi:hypothetical protein
MASTYVNDLRLNEMATGDQSGSWGTVTNTNLELIGEAFSYGTEAITTNADTHTTTISDGATAPGRSMFLKYTGTLDSACTITIGPNTVNKMWFIENATTGSQNIIISQGSGANITIAAGQTKAVYSDGAGAGAAFVDAFAALDVGSLAIAGTLVTSTAAEINILDGVTATAAEINILDGVTATAAEINILDGVTATAAEINYVDGVTSNIQTQLDTKGVVAGSGSIVTTGALNSGSITSGFGTINNGSSTITTTGTVATGAITAGGNITRGGTVIQDGTITDTGDFTIDVAGDIILDADGTAVMFKDAGTEYGRIFNSGTDLVIKSIISNRDMIFQGNDGGTGITALTLDMSEAGAATFNAIVNAPNFNTTSDVRLKDNIRTFESAMDVVSQLRGVRFAWKETGVETVGLIAQEVEKVLPELIGTNADTGLKSVSYSNMVAVLIEAVKELKAEIEELKKR